ncbi:MAG: rhamnulokinase [Victivallaceae bacterium]|nr:rhamnulokinase [Victivallaceae bacterium]
MIRKYLAFDLGASSGRAIIGTLADDRLALAEVHRFPNGPVEKNGSLFWDFEQLDAEIRAGLKKALAAAPDIAGIAIDTWGVDYVLFNRSTGRIVRPPYHYRDARTDHIPEQVHRIISPEKLYRRTGIEFMQLNTLYQLVAHREMHPEDFEDSVLLLMPDALTYMLNGAMTCEYSEASTTNLLDPVKRDWDFELIDLLGLPRSLFPEIAFPGRISAPLKIELRQEFNCGPIPVIKVGSHDTASAVGAVPAPSGRDWAYISCGTWALFGAEIDAPILTDAARLGPFTNEGGLNGRILFLSNIMGTWLFQETRRVWNEAGRNISFAEMAKTAAAGEAFKYLINPNDKLFLTPGDMPAKIREFCVAAGREVPQTDADILRCIYDSLAVYFRTKLEKLEKILGVNYSSLNIVGGGVQDKKLMQYTADCLGFPVEAGPVEATAVGNILTQAIACRDIADLAAARKIVKNSFEVEKYVPNPADKAKWDQTVTKFVSLDQ